MEPPQAAIPIITDHRQIPEEPFREQALLLQEAAAHRTGRFIQGPAPQHRKAGRLIPVPKVVQPDPRDHQHIAGPVRQDRPPIAGPVLQDHPPTADPARQDRPPIADPAVPIQVAAGQADHQVPIPVAADRRVAAVHPTQAAVPGQAVQVAVQVQVAQEDNLLLPRAIPGQYHPTLNISTANFIAGFSGLRKVNAIRNSKPINY
jgi:hypothetical protein